MKPRGEDQARVRRYQTQLQCRGSLNSGGGKGDTLGIKAALEREGERGAGLG